MKPPLSYRLVADDEDPWGTTGTQDIVSAQILSLFMGGWVAQQIWICVARLRGR